MLRCQLLIPHGRHPRVACREDAAEAPEAAAAVARVQPPRPSKWGARTKKQKENWTTENTPPGASLSARTAAGAAETAEDWQMGNASAETATTAAGGAAATGAKAAADQWLKLTVLYSFETGNIMKQHTAGLHPFTP